MNANCAKGVRKVGVWVAELKRRIVPYAGNELQGRSRSEVSVGLNT